MVAALPMVRRALITAACALFAASSFADEAAAWRALRHDGAVALVRHAEAPGIGDPAGWRLGDCPTQRNLSPAGRAQARALGARLKAERIAVARLAASPWCRTVETAELLGVGPVQVDPAFANAFILREQRDTIAAAAKAAIAAWRGPGLLLVVTHGENIGALTGRSPATAELVVVAAQRDGSIREVAAIETPVGR